MFKEFKEFAFKGNMIDMAVGIIIGGAFGTVVSSIVDNLFMPILGSISGGVDFSSKYINLSDTEYANFAAAKEAGAPVIGYGQFINDFIAFLLLALAVFLVVKKALGVLNKPEAPVAAPEPPKQEVLLEEIRDLLKQQRH